MSVGDKVVFNVVNEGMSFHAFGVTQDSEGGSVSVRHGALSCHALQGTMAESHRAHGRNPAIYCGSRL